MPQETAMAQSRLRPLAQHRGGPRQSLQSGFAQRWHWAGRIVRPGGRSSRESQPVREPAVRQRAGTPQPGDHSMASKIRLTGVLLLLLAAAAWAASVRLYLKDGTWQMVREYKVQTDRVRFYSIEQGDWEEIPIDMVDLKRTESEAKKIEEERKQEAAVSEAEEKAEREARHEV